jgi:hypothetical protein
MRQGPQRILTVLEELQVESRRLKVSRTHSDLSKSGNQAAFNLQPSTCNFQPDVAILPAPMGVAILIPLMQPPSHPFRRLDPQKIVETMQQLHGRIERRFPESGLSKVAAELQRVAEETIQRAEWIQKPNLPLRVAAVVLSIAMVGIFVGLIVHIHQFQFSDYTNAIQALDASIGSIVFIGAATLFLLNWEHRIKRERALRAIHELRVLAHIVDMHQLTKDPENYFGRGSRPASPPKRGMTPFELNRYLDYCSDLLALVSKIAALYVQGFPDTVLLDAVDDVEDLTSGLSRKIWQKINILENVRRSIGAEAVADPKAD